jgi:Predicted nucleotide-binding protein containing TIR-like domain
MTTPLPQVFVGSSSEGKVLASIVCEHLSPVAGVTLWNKGVFGLGEGTLEALVSATERFDFAVLVLTPDDVITTRGEQEQTARDNVLFEAGLFMGKLGRFRTFLVYDRRKRIKIPSDLAGVTMAAFGDAPDTGLAEQIKSATDEIAAAIQRLGSINNPPAPFWRPFLSPRSRIVLGRFSEFLRFEPSGLIGLGDAVCLTEVCSFLRSRYNFEVPVRYADRLDGDELRADLITIGGPDANSITKQLVEGVPTGLLMGDPSDHKVSFASKGSGKSFVPNISGNGEVTSDYGVIIRARHPSSGKSSVLGLFGCFGFGTWAAGRCIVSDEFLSDKVVSAGSDLVCIVKTEIFRGVPQPAVILELRPIGGQI